MLCLFFVRCLFFVLRLSNINENHMITSTTESISHLLCTIRAPIQQGEYDLHTLVRETLENGGIPCQHEVPLAPRCRIDFLCGDVGIEIKRGKVDRRRVLNQLTRYAECSQIAALILLTEGTVALPNTIHGKPVTLICLNRLWGIAL